MSIIQCASSEMTTTHILSIVYVIPLDATQLKEKTKLSIVFYWTIISYLLPLKPRDQKFG